ncbi:4Fe-4S binding protein [Defluviimonas sp. D31]|uniref:4Fe-4S binding protein n=1 Tax=Defluviimonas sp. D31 TaxID=3083253 RepID=UPI00296E7E45|nr:4Fe-4S binding protein [Defluviimonas sp. D31]MDW4550748.1 4Fe-4S binding protein [Defluviimonas sp. D31]
MPVIRPVRRLLAAVLFALFAAAAQAAGLAADTIAPAEPDAVLAAQLLGAEGPVTVIREEGAVPGWRAEAGGAILGHLGSTWEIAGSVGYSGRPLDVIVALAPDGRIAGAQLMAHAEPVLTLGISDADIARYVGGFAGVDLTAPRESLTDARTDMPDIISRATVSTAAIRDGILRTARALAIGRGLISETGGIDRVGFTALDWQGLVATGALAHATMTLSEARAALQGGKTPPPEGEAPFLDLWAGLIDPPTVGRNLLGQQNFTRAIGALGAKDVALILVSSGLHSPRGTAWRQSGTFDRIAVVQGGVRLQPTKDDYIFVKKLLIEGAPAVKEIGIYRLAADGFDPVQPFRVEITATRPAESGGDDVATVIGADYALPDAFQLAPPPEPEPLWRSAWQNKRPAIVIVVAMLSVLTLILFLQEGFVRRPKLWRLVRLGFLATTLLVLGWGLNGQLSVVQVVAFLHSLLTGFRWETFLVDPVIFILWSFTALGLLFWGRGVYCGWLCPFGALQELLNAAAQKVGVKQIAVPQALHERLWVIKYTLFLAILALSFYSMHDALVLAEAEPFKTAISLRFLRAWPFLAFVAVLLGAGLFIERFYCRYLCPLGAGIAIPAKLKIFDWLKRRPQCGRECRLCETKCTVGAIDPLGRINPNECVLCLRCQVIYHDASTCTILKRRSRAPGATGDSQ